MSDSPTPRDMPHSGRRVAKLLARRRSGSTVLADPGLRAEVERPGVQISVEPVMLRCALNPRHKCRGTPLVSIGTARHHNRNGLLCLELRLYMHRPGKANGV